MRYRPRGAPCSSVRIGSSRWILGDSGNGNGTRGRRRREGRRKAGSRWREKFEKVETGMDPCPAAEAPERPLSNPDVARDPYPFVIWPTLVARVPVWRL